MNQQNIVDKSKKYKIPKEFEAWLKKKKKNVRLRESLEDKVTKWKLTMWQKATFW